MGETISELTARLSARRDSRSGDSGGGRVDQELIRPIVDELNKKLVDPAFSGQRDQIRAQIADLQSGATDVSMLNNDKGFFGNLFSGLGTAIDVPLSLVQSGSNQISELVKEAAGRRAPEGERNASDELGWGGFVAGTAFGDDRENTRGLEALGLDKDWEGGEIPGFFDLDTILNFGTDVAMDPLSFLRAPGIIADAGGAAAKGLRGGTRAADARIGRAGAQRRLVDNAQAVAARTGKDIDQAKLNAAVESLDSGGVTSLLRDVKKGKKPSQFSLDELAELGVESKMRLGASRLGSFDLPGTGGVATALGAIRTGRLGKLSRLGDKIDQSGLKNSSNAIRDGGSEFASLRAVTIEAGNRRAGNIVKKIMAQNEEVTRRYADLYPEVYRSATEKGLGSSIENDVARVLLAKGKKDESFTAAVDVLQRWSQDIGSPTFQRIKDEGLFDDYMRNSDIPVEARRLAPAIMNSLKELDESATKLGMLTGEVTERGSSTIDDLLGVTPEAADAVQTLVQKPGVLVQGFGTARQLVNNVAVVKVLGESATTVDGSLGEYFFKASDNATQKVFETFGITYTDIGEELQGVVDEALETVTGSGDELAGLLSRGEDLVGLNVARNVQRAYQGLKAGDTAAFATELDTAAELGAAQLDKYETFIYEVLTDGGGLETAARNEVKKLLNNTADGGRNALEAKVDRILKNEMYNPAMRNSDVFDRAKMMSTEDRNFLRAVQELHPEYITGSLAETRSWFTDWAVGAKATFEQYSANFTPETAKVLTDIDTFFHSALLQSRLMVAGLGTAAGGSAALLRKFPKEQADLLARQVMDFHYKAGGTNTFGGIRGNGTLGWDAADAMAEHSRYLNSLKRADFGDSKVFGAAQTINRAFRPLATFGPGFVARNAMGAYRVNFTQGVRTAGVGGYREWQPVYTTALKALKDETANDLAAGTSALWKGIPAGQRETAKDLAASGVLTTGSGTGAIGRAFELSERSVGARTGALADTVGRTQNRIEQAVGSLVESGTAGRPSGRNLRSDFKKGVDGIESSTRKEVETYMRGALMWSSMRKGESLDAALLKVSRNHFDYWDLSTAGQRIDELMPFYVFRARMTTLSAQNAIATPGLAAQVSRLRDAGEDEDPWGRGKFERYTFGAGKFRGVDWATDLEDPFESGFATIEAFADLPTSVQGIKKLWETEGVGAAAPVYGFAYNALTGLASSQDGTYAETAKPLREVDGIGPRLLEGLSSIPPLRFMLEQSGNLNVVDGEVFITKNSAQFLSNALPILGRLESMFTSRDFVESDGTRRKRAEGDEPDSMGEGAVKAWNTFFSFTGIPYQLFSEGYRDAQVQDAVWDVRGYADPFSELRDLREADQKEDFDKLYASLFSN